MKIKKILCLIFVSILIVMLPLSANAMNEDELLNLVFEKANFLEDYCGCAGFSLLNNDSYTQNLELLEHLIYEEIFIEPIYPAIEEFQDYENYKQLILSHATPFLTMQLFSVRDKFFNINGRLYLQDTGAPYGEGGLNYVAAKILEEKDDYLTVAVTSRLTNQDQTIGLKKYNDSWRIDYIQWDIGLEPSLVSEEYIEQVFRNYICNVIRSYLLSANVNCGYEKYSQNAIYLTSLKINVTEYDLDSCTGSGYAVVEEHDKNGNIVGEHKITVEIGENLSDTVIDEVLSFVNPETSDIHFECYIYFVLTFALSAHLLLKIRKKKDR